MISHLSSIDLCVAAIKCNVAAAGTSADRGKQIVAVSARSSTRDPLYITHVIRLDQQLIGRGTGSFAVESLRGIRDPVLIAKIASRTITHVP